jgi:hypothetical protein
MVRVTINTDNAAFDDGNREDEIARILEVLARRFRNRETSRRGRVQDVNGNSCGEYFDDGR